jgi:uncharacterized protein YndB with AHSA1/START domain/class 3 adenylate cyclase
VSSLSTAERGCLVLADISGYTDLLLSTELEHAEDAVNDLLKRVVESLEPVLALSKLEGDAVFAYVLDGEFSTSTLLDTIDKAYDAFRRRLRDIDYATTCPCNACLQLPGLDLKFVAHHGTFVRRDGDLVGRDVIVVHRLLKNRAAQELGSRGYLLLTQACADALGLDSNELGLRPHTERYDDVGEIACWLDDLSARWQAEQERTRVYVPREGASFERTVKVPQAREVVWDWLTSPAKRTEWQADSVLQVAGGGRARPGATNHCIHGDDVTIEEVVDWRPFDYYTVRYDFPFVGETLITGELTDAEGGGTHVSLRAQGYEGELQEAWLKVAPMLTPEFDHMFECFAGALGVEWEASAA